MAPNLLAQAFVYLKNHPTITLDQLLADASTAARIYSSHLREFWLNLQQHPHLAVAGNASLSLGNI